MSAFSLTSADTQRSDVIAYPRWRELLGEVYGLRCEPAFRDPWQSAIDVCDFGEVKVAQVCMSRQTLAPRCRMEVNEDNLFLKLVTGGRATFEQNGEQHGFCAGNLVIVDPARPFVESVEEGTQLVVLTCPKAALRERGYRSQLNHWVSPDPESADVRMVLDMVRLMASYHRRLEASTRALLSRQMLDLMEVVMTRGAASAQGRTSEAVRYRVKRYIAEHLGEEGLDAASIASGVGLSISYLQRLFREEGTSLMRCVWNQRLERARDLLRPSAPDRLRVDVVAWRCGFSSAAHFSRLFRQHYGFSPRQFRESPEVANTASMAGGTF
ncbi:MAG: helix-turn-helix domain-containing protein [Trinickia sp.]|uniref:helix-turn-helix domain-containing protein n=1 Tax=Trinickia sp. TaxID=2571163 RepID=UPI003F80E6C2